MSFVGWTTPQYARKRDPPNLKGIQPIQPAFYVPKVQNALATAMFKEFEKAKGVGGAENLRNYPSFRQYVAEELNKQVREGHLSENEVFMQLRDPQFTNAVANLGTSFSSAYKTTLT